MVQALAKEIHLQKDFLQGEAVSTIYFGGGTPSLLSLEETAHLLETLTANFTITPDAEITLEANPDDITNEKLAGWKAAGINRLSIGVQSFFEEELRWMNRAHSASQARSCIESSLQHGFDNISIDLIYGSPFLTDDQWHQNVAIATGYGIPHLSCYALTVEEKTPLHQLIAKNKKANVDSEKQARQFLLLMQWLEEKGYEHYEVSNFARPGYRSRHNSSYWKGIPYLGIGPSAHSYNGTLRKWNIANNGQYIQAINNNSTKSETEILTPVQKLNEYIMISLRTIEGLDLKYIKKEWGEDKVTLLQKRLQRFENSHLVTQQNNMVQLTNDGMLMADGIAADLFS